MKLTLLILREAMENVSRISLRKHSALEALRVDLCQRCCDETGGELAIERS